MDVLLKTVLLKKFLRPFFFGLRDAAWIEKTICRNTIIFGKSGRVEEWKKAAPKKKHGRGWRRHKKKLPNDVASIIAGRPIIMLLTARACNMHQKALQSSYTRSIGHMLWKVIVYVNHQKD